MASDLMLMEAEAVTKRFGETVANDTVDLAIRPGEIHALLGENGAGKSTLVKILYGALQPDEGILRWKGETLRIGNPAAARTLGIGMVFQHFSLFEALTVAENIALALPGNRKLADLSKEIGAVSARYGLPLEASAIVADLSVGERQRIEIVRCLLQEPDLIILDEPTSVLTPQEAEQLFQTLERLATEGCAVLYISHRLEEVKRLCQSATILRGGRVVATTDPRTETAASLARLMIGEDVGAVVRPDRGTGEGTPRLEVDDLSLPADNAFGVSLKHVSVAVRSGEILAVAGVAGNGQGELFDALSGERLSTRADAIRIDGNKVGRMPINERRRLGAAFVPEERLGHGAVPVFRLSENALLSRHAVGDGLKGSALLHKQGMQAVSENVIETFDVRSGGGDAEARSLSGGNLQKFVVGRELDRSPSLVVINQPTWGVDAGAAALIRQALIDLARSGSAIVAISQDLDEIFEIADRICVISRGELSEAYPAETLPMEEIGLLMAGKAERARTAHATDAPPPVSERPHAD
ncbi:MAG: ABC transporter ATP-binding protein [Pseudomonadota bacterium]